MVESGEKPRSGMPVSPEIEIRRANSDDADAIANVLYESFLEFRPLYTDGGFSGTAIAAGQVRIRMGEGPVWVVLRNRVPVGTVSAIVKGVSAYIRGMAVLPAARGSRAGSRLLAEVEKWAAVEGCERLFLSTTPFLDSAI